MCSHSTRLLSCCVLEEKTKDTIAYSVCAIRLRSYTYRKLIGRLRLCARIRSGTWRKLSRKETSTQEEPRYSVGKHFKAGCTLHHEINHGGRDHLITKTSENGLLMIANVHLEPNSTLRELRLRLRAIYGHWPCYPAGVGLLVGDFNIYVNQKTDCTPKPHPCASSQE